MYGTTEGRSGDLSNITNFNGVVCGKMDHPVYVDGKELGFLKESSESRKRAIEFLRNNRGSSIFIDSLLASFLLQDMFLNQVDSRCAVFKELNPYMFDVFANGLENGCVVLFGDFWSEVGMKRDRDRTEDGLLGGILGCITLSGIESGLMGMAGKSRRNFLKLFPLIVVGNMLSTLYAGQKIYEGIMEDHELSTRDRENENLVMRAIQDKFGDPLAADSVLRTGIVTRKQQIATKFLLPVLGRPETSMAGLWGSDHFYDPARVEMAQKVYEDPFPYVQNLLERETSYLVAKGASMLEVSEKISYLKYCMAAIVPTTVMRNGDVIDFLSINVSEGGNPVMNVAFDSVILGFQPEGLTLKQIRDKCWVQAQALCFKLTDRDGLLKI